MGGTCWPQGDLGTGASLRTQPGEGFSGQTLGADLVQATFIGYLWWAWTQLNAMGIMTMGELGPGPQNPLSFGGTRNCTICNH